MTTLARLAVTSVLLAAAPLAAQEPAWLEVGWISREPRIPPPARRDAPVEEGWPESGAIVHWVAHVLNRSDRTVADVGYAWWVDGELVAAGRIDLPPGETTLWQPWSWAFERQTVSFTLEPAPGVDASSGDDTLSVASNALSVGFLVEQGLYEWLLTGGRPGFERLMQRELVEWNAILADAVHPTTPAGVSDRLRLDQVLVVTDGSGGRTVFDTDVAWWFRTRASDPRFLHAGIEGRHLRDQTILLHEMLHLRGLIDLYAYTVVHGDTARTDSRIDILEDGRPVVGSVLMPALGSGNEGIVVYRTPFQGLMGSRYVRPTQLTEHSANGLERVAGRRTPLWLDQWGNQINGWSGVPDPGSYVRAVPDRTRLRIVDRHGDPVRDAAVDVYLDHSIHTYQKLYGPAPDATLGPDGEGLVPLPRSLLDAQPAYAGPSKAQVIILGVRTPAGRGFAFVPVHDLNLLYFRGGEEEGELQVDVTLHPWSVPLTSTP